MSGFRDVSLKWRLFGLTGLLLAVIVVQGVLALAGKPSHGVTTVLLVAGLLAGAGACFLTVRYLTGGFDRVDARLEACAVATREHLLPALQALAAGDLTLELHAGTAATRDFSGMSWAASCATSRCSARRCWSAMTPITRPRRDFAS